MSDAREEAEGLRQQLAAAHARTHALEAELAEAQGHQRALLSIMRHAPDFLAQITPDGRYLFASKWIAAQTAAELQTTTIFDYSDPAYHPQMRAALARAVETGTQQAYETTSLHVPGQPAPVPYYARIAPLIEAGTTTSLVLIATDIARLKRAEAAYDESQTMLHHVLTATGMGMWWWDRDRAVGGNDAACARIFGFDPGAAGGFASVMDRIPDEDRARVQAGLAQAFETGAYGPIEHRVRRADGSVRWVSANGVLLTSPTGARVIGGVLDITERKRLEEQLAQAQKMESIGRLAGGIAHDFNNMLTAILSYNQFALAAVPADSRVAKDLGEVRRAAERSVALTAQLLAFARQQMIAPSLAHLDVVVRDVEGLLRRALGESCELVLRLRAQHPVQIDVNQFEQVLLNLTSNARDAMPRGGKLVIETADLEIGPNHPELAAGPYVVMTVSDTGDGIPAHLLARVFEPFFTTKDHGKGTGLGLATCYGIVTQNGGHISVRSGVGRGTQFTVSLPRAEGEVVPAVPVAVVPAVGGTETVLVVEDEASVRAVTILTLEQAGYRVLAATNGHEALALARAHVGHIALVVTDVVMPQLGGAQLVEQLRVLRPAIAVLFVSGYTDNAAIHDGVHDGEVDLLQKPFSPSVLAARVRAALDRPARAPRD